MKNTVAFISLLLLASCAAKKNQFDAQGTFESDEVLVSGEVGGKLVQFNVEEGKQLRVGDTVGWVDAVGLQLQQEQVEASIGALSEKTADAVPQVQLYKNQIAVQQAQLENLMLEKGRIERLIKADAATGKQLDDIKFQIETVKRQLKVTEQQISVAQNNVQTQNRSVLSEAAALKKRAAQIADQSHRAIIVNPVAGTVLTKYAQLGEVAAPGKALYKIADLNVVTLRAYVTGDQIPQIKLGQTVQVLTDSAAGVYRRHSGVISWIADKAEFTPKTIQTKEERANLVYAIKVRVKNDGSLKIGMYGEVSWH